MDIIITEHEIKEIVKNYIETTYGIENRDIIKTSIDPNDNGYVSITINLNSVFKPAKM